MIVGISKTVKGFPFKAFPYMALEIILGNNNKIGIIRHNTLVCTVTALSINPIQPQYLFVRRCHGYTV